MSVVLRGASGTELRPWCTVHYFRVVRGPNSTVVLRIPGPTNERDFVSTAGTRLLYCNVQQTFRTLVRRAGLRPHAAACRPRLHDIRHRFAVCTLLDAYRQGQNPGARIALLATYLGHVDPKYTYWYLSAAPELMQLATDHLERHLGASA